MLPTKDFNKIRKYACEFAAEDYFPLAFPSFCLRVFFPEIALEKIDEAVSGLSTNDESIDAYWINDENKTINIAQFKSVENTNSIGPAKKEWFSYLDSVEDKLSDPEFVKKHKNKRIRDEIGDSYRYYVQNEYRLVKYLFHIGYADEQTVEFHDDIHYYGFTEILDAWNEYNSLTETTDPPECQITIDFLKSGSATEQLIKYNPTQKYSTVITLISGRELVKLRDEYRYQLFDRNVRFYLGTSNKINSEIVQTAKNTPDNFYYYNNGITITCSRCRHSEVGEHVRLKLELPQIINGAQTVSALHAAYSEMLRKKKAKLGKADQARAECDKHFERIKVLVRIIESTKHAEAAFSTSLTKFNNSQSSVKLVDFYANRPEQIELQKRLLKYGLFYERKRGERDYVRLNKTNEYGIDVGTLKHFATVELDLKRLAGLYQAYLGHPSAREVGDRYILDESNRDNYETLFGNSKSSITDEKVRDIVLAIFLFDIIEKYAKVYTQLLKVVASLEEKPSEEKLFGRFVSLVKELDFLTKNISEPLASAKTFDAVDKDILARIYNYRLLGQGKYLVTAMIHHILDLTRAKDSLLEKNLFDNPVYLKQSVCRPWLNKLVVKFINPIRAEDNNRRSENAFFLDPTLLEKFKKRLDDFIYEDDYQLATEFSVE
ncbi:MAG: AIPR family protein [Syntrophales bacterium]|nr:AIPR family protein [Syntrophales bacterium]